MVIIDGGDLNAPSRSIFDPPEIDEDEDLSEFEDNDDDDWTHNTLNTLNTLTTRDTYSNSTAYTRSTAGGTRSNRRRQRHRHRKHPSQLNEVELRVQLWDSYRLARIILGTPIKSFSLKGKTILHSIRKVAEMKLELIRLQKQLEMAHVLVNASSTTSTSSDRRLGSQQKLLFFSSSRPGSASAATSVATTNADGTTGPVANRSLVEQLNLQIANILTPEEAPPFQSSLPQLEDDGSAPTPGSVANTPSKSKSKPSSDPTAPDAPTPRRKTRTLSTAQRLELYKDRCEQLQRTHTEMIVDLQSQLMEVQTQLLPTNKTSMGVVGASDAAAAAATANNENYSRSGRTSDAVVTIGDTHYSTMASPCGSNTILEDATWQTVGSVEKENSRLPPPPTGQSFQEWNHRLDREESTIEPQKSLFGSSSNSNANAALPGTVGQHRSTPSKHSKTCNVANVPIENAPQLPPRNLLLDRMDSNASTVVTSHSRQEVLHPPNSVTAVASRREPTNNATPVTLLANSSTPPMTVSDSNHATASTHPAPFLSASSRQEAPRSVPVAHFEPIGESNKKGTTPQEHGMVVAMDTASPSEGTVVAGTAVDRLDACHNSVDSVMTTALPALAALSQEENMAERQRLQQLIQQLLRRVDETSAHTQAQFRALQEQLRAHGGSFDDDEEEEDYAGHEPISTKTLHMVEQDFEKRLRTTQTLHTLELETFRSRHTQQVVDMSGQLDAYQQQVERQNSELQKWRRKYHHLEEMAVTPAEAKEVLSELEVLAPNSTPEEQERVQSKVVQVLQRMTQLQSRQQKEIRALVKTRTAALAHEAGTQAQLDHLNLQKELLEHDTQISPEQWEEQLAQQRKTYQKEISNVFRREEKRLVEMEYMEVQLTELAFLAVKIEDLERESVANQQAHKAEIAKTHQRLEVTVPSIKGLQTQLQECLLRQRESLSYLAKEPQRHFSRQDGVEALRERLENASTTAATLQQQDEELQLSRADLIASQERVRELEAKLAQRSDSTVSTAQLSD